MRAAALIRCELQQLRSEASNRVEDLVYSRPFPFSMKRKVLESLTRKVALRLGGTWRTEDSSDAERR